MVMRLVLVGLVAGLGFTFPNRRDIDALGRSAQRWVSARLAEWDSQASSDEGTFVFIAEAPATIPSEADQPVVSDQEFAAVVEEMVGTFAQAELASRPRGTEEAVTVADAVAPSDAPDSLAIAPPTEPAPVIVAVEPAPAVDLATLDEPAAAEEPTAADELATADDPVAAEEPATADVTFASIVDEMASSFAIDLAELRSAARADLEIAAIMDEMARELTPVAADPAPTPVEPAPVAAADEIVEGDVNLQEDVAYVLNRLSDNIDEPESEPEPVDAPAPVTRQDRLTNAVRLTREAVYAWTSLLHGPAVVAISR